MRNVDAEVTSQVQLKIEGMATGCKQFNRKHLGAPERLEQDDVYRWLYPLTKRYIGTNPPN